MRYAEHLEITLEKSILTRGSVLHNICVVKLDFLSIDRNGKIVLVDFRAGFLRECHTHGILVAIGYKSPFPETRENFIYIVTRLVNAGSSELSASAGDLPFGRIAAVNHGNGVNLCHIISQNNNLSHFWLPHWYPRHLRCSSGQQSFRPGLRNGQTRKCREIRQQAPSS